MHKKESLKIYWVESLEKWPPKKNPPAHISRKKARNFIENLNFIRFFFKLFIREEKAEHEKIMFDLIGSRSDHLLRLTAYISKHCDPFNSPTSVILIPAYLHGDIGTYLKESYLFIF